MNNMEKEFVPYKLALRLKALGFDEPCFHLDGLGKVSYAEFGYGAIPIPLYSQAFRWVREKYDLFTHIEKGENPKNFYPIIDNVSHKYNPKLWFDTYEEAELACLEELIEIVESKSE